MDSQKELKQYTTLPLNIISVLPNANKRLL